jgi:hypothetical protein
MLSGANALEISDIQEDETDAALTRRSDVTMLHWVEMAGWSFREAQDHAADAGSVPLG